jgi:hypothetical protein
MKTLQNFLSFVTSFLYFLLSTCQNGQNTVGGHVFHPPNNHPQSPVENNQQGVLNCIPNKKSPVGCQAATTVLRTNVPSPSGRVRAGLAGLGRGLAYTFTGSFPHLTLPQGGEGTVKRQLKIDTNSKDIFERLDLGEP